MRADMRADMGVAMHTDTCMDVSIDMRMGMDLGMFTDMRVHHFPKGSVSSLCCPYPKKYTDLVLIETRMQTFVILMHMRTDLRGDTIRYDVNLLHMSIRTSEHITVCCNDRVPAGL